MKKGSRVLVAAALCLLLLLVVGNLAFAQAGDAESGKALFGEYCAVCHGYDGRGRVGADLTGWFSSIDPRAFVKSTVSDGVADTMPAFAQSKGGPLTDAEIDDIAAFVLSWQERVEPAPTPTPVPVTPIPEIAGIAGDPTLGVQVFARECQVCHGEKGQGGVGASLSGPIAASQPAAFLRQVIGQGINGSPMPAFAEVLGEDEIENVVAYVLSWDRQPVSQPVTEDEDNSSFNWLVGLLFVIVITAVVVWLVTHFSQRREPT